MTGNRVNRDCDSASFVAFAVRVVATATHAPSVAISERRANTACPLSAFLRYSCAMSERNGEKSRFQINRKRAVLRRTKVRELLAAAAAGAEKRPAHAKARRAKG